MGLPAFDLSDFDAATAAVTRAPRVSTSIFFGPGVLQHAREDANRQKLKRTVNQYISDIHDWKIGSIAALAKLRETFSRGLSVMPISHYIDIINKITSYEEDVIAYAQKITKQDSEAVSHAYDELSKFIDAPKYALNVVYNEYKRIEKAHADRRATLERLALNAKVMRQTLEEYVVRQSLPVPDFSGPDEAAAYAEHVKARPVDIEGVTARTQRMLARFPKASEYLGR